MCTKSQLSDLEVIHGGINDINYLIPGSKWWIETDETSFEIVGTYNKAQITADIQAINATLATMPDPAQEATDVQGILNRVSTASWTPERITARVTELVNAIYAAYQGDPRSVEVAQLIAKRDTLVVLRERLV